jgi:hypothetical protein
MAVLATKNLEKQASKFYCQICDFSTSKKTNYDSHILTQKHIRNTLATTCNIVATEKKQSCDFCGKEYKDRTGLWRHKKKCQIENCNNKIIEDTPKNNTIDNTLDNAINTEKNDIYELVKYLMKENSELKNMMMEQQNLVLEIAKNTGNNNNNTTNSHNKTFNLQIFLNETCKDAMNIMDFVDQIVLNLNDLEETGRLGFAEGISKMILKRLKTLDVTQRPIHCSDLKRETLYIKDENKWEKEDETKPKLTKAVKEISAKNIRQIKDWQKKHPDYNDPESKTSDKYMNMVMNVMAGGTQEEIQENYEKIIKNITKETTIAKEKFLI